MKWQTFKPAIASAVAAAMLAGASSVWISPAFSETLVVAGKGTPEGFDGDKRRPGTMTAVVNVYEGITRYGRIKNADGSEMLDSGVIEGHLATGWNVTDGGKKVTFNLRKGVKSFVGNEMTADDWVWSWNKSFHQKRTGNFIARVSNVVPNGVKKIDDYTVEFNLEGPSSIFLRAITLYTPSIYDTKVAKEGVTKDDPFAEKFINDNTLGFGPYHVTELKPGEKAVYSFNPNFFGKKPFFDKVIYRAVPSGASRVTLLKSGQVHIVENMTAQQISELSKDNRVKVIHHTGRGIAAARMNSKIAPFTDKKVRKAFNYAVDKQQLINTVFEGVGKPANTLVPGFITGSLKGATPYPYNPAKAKALLAEAGYPDGLEIELKYATLQQWQEPLAIQLQNQLGKVGVKVSLNKMQNTEFRKRSHISKMDMQFFVYQDGPIVLDPVYTMYLIARSTGVSNRTAYKNEKVDALIDEARVSLDEKKKNSMMQEAQKIWMDDAPWIVTTFPPFSEALNGKLKGYVYYPDDNERWIDLYL